MHMLHMTTRLIWAHDPTWVHTTQNAHGHMPRTTRAVFFKTVMNNTKEGAMGDPSAYSLAQRSPFAHPTQTIQGHPVRAA